MKYVRGLPQTNNDLSKALLDAGWQRLKEPQRFTLTILYSMPIAIIVLVLELLLLI